MKDLKEPTVMELANDYITEGKATLEQIEASFKKLPSEDQKRVFGSLCIRKRHTGLRLTDLLLTLAPVIYPQRTATIGIFLSLWESKRGADGLAESLRQALAEQHAP